MSDRSQIYRAFVFKCEKRLSEDDAWRATGATVDQDDNFGTWLVWAVPKNGKIPVIRVELDLSKSIGVRQLAVWDSAVSVGVNQDGTPVDARLYQEAVDYVCQRLIGMAVSA